MNNDGNRYAGDGAEEEIRKDTNRNPVHSDMVCLIHTNGVHRLLVVICGCRGPDEIFLDLAFCRLVPTSFTRIKTLFTSVVLDDFRITNLECKALANQYWQRLRRMTSSMAPETVDNRYKELLRMLRLWRWMKKLKWSSYAHGQAKRDGYLTIFCPACPQPGINIDPNWKLDKNRCVHQLSYFRH